MDDAAVIAIVGAESTGKTALAQALAARIAAATGLAATWVPEHLRDWCDRAGRTPRADEQEAIAAAQAGAIDAAAAAYDVVVADTTPLMTAVYSEMLFDDASLIAPAVAWQRRCALTLLTALDLPWVADGLQRDGPHVQGPVDTALRRLLVAHRLPWAVVGGTGDARVEQALDAVAPLLRKRPMPRDGLLTRLDDRTAEDAARLRPICQCCGDPDCERAARAP